MKPKATAVEPLAVPDVDVESNVRYLDGLAKFLSLKGNTLLIKGYAGAGKTTLSLQLLQQLSKDGSGVYISSRVSQDKVTSYLPWVGTETISGRRYKFLDIRLGTASSVLEELASVVDAKGRGKRPAVIVLDTWDALAKEMEEKERLKAEKMLIALADSSKARVIFVSEEPGRTTMDYLVDGIIELVRSEEYGRIFREVEVQKLRGTLVDQHKYLYTLLGGVFRHLQPYKAPTLSDAKKFAPVPDLDFAFSFGSEQMDQAFGGLRRGSTFALEYNEKIPYTAIRTIEITMVINALNVGHAAFLIPLPGASVEGVRSLIEPFVSPEVFTHALAIGILGGQESLKPPFCPLSTESPKTAGADISNAMDRVRRGSKKGDLIAVESLGALENTFASNINGLLENFATRVSKFSQESSDALLITLEGESPLESRVLAMCRGYARLFVKDRSIVLMGEKPNTEAFVLEHSETNSLIPKLTRIV